MYDQWTSLHSADWISGSWKCGERKFPCSQGIPACISVMRVDDFDEDCADRSDIFSRSCGGVACEYHAFQ